MENSTFEERLATFKTARVECRPFKWPHRRLSMAGMARAFYYYDPIPSATDRVACAQCGAHFANWAEVKMRPLQRHAETGNGCFVAELARIYAGASQGTDVDFGRLTSALVASFTYAGASMSSNLKNVLASEGFIWLPKSAKNLNTVGCIDCNCFPQDGLGKPQHSGKCHFFASLCAARDKHFTVQNSSRKAQKSVCPTDVISTKPTTPTKTPRASNGTSNVSKVLVLYRSPEIQPFEPENNRAVQMMSPLNPESPPGVGACAEYQPTRASRNHFGPSRQQLLLVQDQSSPRKGRSVGAQAEAVREACVKPRVALAPQSIELPVELMPAQSPPQLTPLSRALLKVPNAHRVSFEAKVVEFALRYTDQKQAACIADNVRPFLPPKESQLKPCEEIAFERCNSIFNQLIVDCDAGYVELYANATRDKTPVLELISKLERLAISALERVHIQRIQLIQQETDRVISQLLAS